VSGVAAGARVAVVGHVEWVELAVIDHFPEVGEIVDASEWFTEAAGSAAVAAVQMRRLGGAATFFTALGDDEPGRRAAAELSGRHGLELFAVRRERPQRRGFVQLDDFGERTITILGERLVPRGDDDLPWERLAGLDAVYLSGGDAAAVRLARAARALVATPRAYDALVESGVQLDVLIASATDPGEQVDLDRLASPPRYVVRTEGSAGGTWTAADGTSGRWESVPPPGAPVDAYGCGDSFAGGVTYGLAAGLPLPSALDLGARCGAWCLAGRGPYGHQLGAV
jgi:ribokinase